MGPRSSTALWKAVLLYTSRLDNAPQMVCADCSFDLSREEDIPWDVLTALRRGLLLDIMGARAEARAQRPRPAYVGGSGTETRIDGILMDPRVALWVQYEAAIKKAGVPGHSLLRVTLNLDMACPKVLKIGHLEAPPEQPLLGQQKRQEMAQALWKGAQRGVLPNAGRT